MSSITKDDYSFFNGKGFYFAIIVLLYVLIPSIPALIALGAIIPIASRKHLNHRDYADTFGSLPLTYNQRYWGDLLSELAVYITPIIPAGIHSCIMMKVYMENIQDTNAEKTLSLVIALFISVLISALGAIALSGFVAQCCGKTGSGLMYTFIIGLLLPIFVMEYGNIVENNALGIPRLDAALQACSTIPPFGIMLKALVDINYGYNLTEEIPTVNSPILLSVMLVIIAAWIAGGYFLGKKRRAELVGESFLFKAVSLVISVIAALSILGFFLTYIDFDGLDSIVIISLVVAFIFFMGFEFLTKRRKMKFLKSLIIYGCVVVAGFGFTALMHFTESFGVGNHIPNINSVREITIDSGYSHNGGEYVFDDKDAMQVIIDQHQKLLESKDRLRSGYTIKISYKLKNGTSLTRKYDSYSFDDTIIDDFINKVFLLPQSGSNRFTILARDDIDLKMRVHSESVSSDEEIAGRYTVKPEKVVELRKALYEDISDNPSVFLTDGEQSWGSINVEYYENKQKQFGYYIIFNEYTRTIEFLSNPDNLTTSTRTEINSTDKFILYYNDDGVCIHMNFADKDRNRLPDEFYNLLSPKQPDTEYSEYFEVLITDNSQDTLFIKKSDEERARELFFEALESYELDSADSFYNIDIGGYKYD
ncbi:MAG: hypothetical protein ACI4JS_10475 [Oscillospiraceae bacterium]